MILSSIESIKSLENGEIQIEPLVEEAIGPCSIDLTLSDQFTVFKRIGMNEEIHNLFSDTLKTPTSEKINQIENYLKEEILAQGFTFPNDFLQMLLETVHHKGRPYVIKHSYL